MAVYKIRKCLFCGNGFQPPSSTGWHCSWECRFKEIVQYIKNDKNGCLNFPAAINSEGYATLKISQTKTIKAHRAAWELSKGEIPSGMLVCHHCDNRRCVNVEHLFLGTVADNNRDKQLKGRAGRLIGVLHHKARLTEDDVRAIRGDGRTQMKIAASYGIKQATVSQIKRRVSWKHI